MRSFGHIPPFFPLTLESFMFYGGILGLIIGGITLTKQVLNELSPKRHYRELRAKSRYGWRYSLRGEHAEEGRAEAMRQANTSETCSG